MKLGKKPFAPDPRDLCFATYRTAAPLPPHPRTFGHDALVKSWGMLGNDVLGLCGEAMAAHFFMLECACSKKPIDADTASVIKLYSAVTGYDPSDPSTDQGTVLRDLLKYLRTTGYTDAAGRVHKIRAFVRLNPKDLNEIEEAAYLFGSVMIGVQLPQSAMDQFNDGKPWTVVKGSPIDGGHAILGVGFNITRPAGFVESALATLGLATPMQSRFVTWGAVEPAGMGWCEDYIDEAWACLTDEYFGADGKTLDGFDAAQLEADLAAVASSP